MKITKSTILYNIIINLLVCFFLCLTSAIITYGKNIDWLNFLLNYGVSFVIAMCIGLFIPLVSIGKWFTSLFHVDNTTYEHNIKYRLLSTFIISCIYFILLNPFLTILNVVILADCSWNECLWTWLSNIPIMLLVGFLSSLISDLPAYKLTKKVDSNF